LGNTKKFEVAKVNVFGNPNVGVYVFANDYFAFIPPGLTPSERDLIAEILDVEVIEVTIAQTRLIGVLMNGNNNGLILARNILPDELERIRQATRDMNVIVLDSKNNAVGNLVVANSRYALAYPFLNDREIKQISDALGVEVERGSIANVPTVGSALVVTDKGGIIHPEASDEEIETLSRKFKVPITPGTVNFGVAFIRTGLVANNKGAIVGEETTGPELARIQMALGGGGSD
jgi:translation initiation factor 6